MSIFSQLVKDIKNVGTLNSYYSKRVVKLLNLLMDYSHGKSVYSKEVNYQKALALYLELDEIKDRFHSLNEIITIYNSNGNIELTIEEVQIGIALCGEAVFEEEKTLTYTLISVYFNKAKYLKNRNLV